MMLPSQTYIYILTEHYRRTDFNSALVTTHFGIVELLARTFDYRVRDEFVSLRNLRPGDHFVAFDRVYEVRCYAFR